MPSNVKANKRRGHAAEAEAGRITSQWPGGWDMVRTGLDGGHDLTGLNAIGEVKAVKAGPVWLKDGIRQMDDNSEGKRKLILLKLSNGPGKPTRWFVIQDLAQWEEAIEHEPEQAHEAGGRPAGEEGQRAGAQEGEGHREANRCPAGEQPGDSENL